MRGKTANITKTSAKDKDVLLKKNCYVIIRMNIKIIHSDDGGRLLDR